MAALLNAALGATVGLGLLLVVAGLAGRSVLPRLWSRSGPDRVDGGSRMLLWVAAGLVAGVGVLLVTGWPVAAVTIGGLVPFLPRFLGGGRERAAFIARTEAIATWTEMIRDNLSGAAGLEQALLATTPLAPDAIRPEVQRLATRLDRQAPLAAALRAFGDELDHPSADLVVVAIAKAARMEVRELSPLLSRLAVSIRDDVRMRLRVEVSRARIRTSARIVIGSTAFFVAALYVVAPRLLEPYDTLAGQLWMVVVVGVFLGAGWLIGYYAQLELPTRYRLKTAATTAGPIDGRAAS